MATAFLAIGAGIKSAFAGGVSSMFAGGAAAAAAKTGVAGVAATAGKAAAVKLAAGAAPGVVSALPAATGWAGAGAAGAAGAGAAAAGGGFSLSNLSSLLSVGSALSSIMGGNATADGLLEQSQQIDTQVAQSKARDAQRRATLAAEYADLVSDQYAVQLANGLNPGIGTPATIRRATTTMAEQNLGVSRENTRARTATARLQQRSLFKSANAARVNGWTDALSTGLKAFQTVG